MSDYPAWRYHRTMPACLVDTAEADARLGDEWADTPAAFNAPMVDEPPAVDKTVPVTPAQRLWRGRSPIRRHRKED